jgi:hypothetical protein
MLLPLMGRLPVLLLLVLLMLMLDIIPLVVGPTTMLSMMSLSALMTVGRGIVRYTLSTFFLPLVRIPSFRPPLLPRELSSHAAIISCMIAG